MVCRNICKEIYSKIVVGESHYFVGKKYCRRCEFYVITKQIFCQCCGMQLRGTPAERECKEKMNRKIENKDGEEKEIRIRYCIENPLCCIGKILLFYFWSIL